MNWSGDLAYVIGLITTDGSLSIDGRHINLTSKDIEQIKTFARILNLKNKIENKKSSYNPKGSYYQIQFGNVKFYQFLLSIGLTPNKTKTLGPLGVPDKFFADFLRGHLDGDGYTYSYWDKRWKSSFMFYIGFVSASRSHLEWIQEKVQSLYLICGKIKYSGKSTFQLIYSKRGALPLIEKLYHSNMVSSLARKRFKIEAALAIIKKHADVLELVDRHA